ncbi:transposase, partial [Salinivibrio costicola]|uniref:transposase n=1 Tax=Salinivibrio costicola TaxID=51367 RepID=UPI001F36CEBB
YLSEKRAVMSAIYCPITKRPFNHQAGRNTRLLFYSRSYCLVSCGGAPLEIVKQYLDQQEGFD